MTLSEIVEQLRSCDYQCEGGPLVNNVAFRELEYCATQEMKLEPCPFCGSHQVELMTNDYADHSWVACKVCRVQGVGDSKPREAIKKWNRRVGK